LVEAERGSVVTQWQQSRKVAEEIDTWRIRRQEGHAVVYD
jgi:hypothetical protein